MTAELECLLKERENQTTNIADCDEAIRKTFFFLVTTFAIFAGIYTDEHIIKLADRRTFVIIAISQLVFLIMLKWILEFSAQLVHVGFNRSLEKRINIIVGKPALLWDSVIARRFLGQPRSAFFATSLLLLVSGVTGFAVVGWFVGQNSGNWWFAPLVIIEIVILLVLLIWALGDVGRVEQYSDELLNVTKIAQKELAIGTKRKKQNCVNKENQCDSI